MQSSTNKSHKVNNILIRHTGSKDLISGTTFQHPENVHLRKYSPKYYNGLILEVTNDNLLQSKIKRIKKLKKFTGHFKGSPSSNLWSGLLANTRKELEEIPQIIPTYTTPKINKLFWAKLMLWKMRFFPNITRIFLPRRKVNYGFGNYDCALLKKNLMGYLRNMRKIKTLEMFLEGAGSEGENSMLKKLDGMDQSFERIKVNLVDWGGDLGELFKNKNLASRLTSLTFPDVLTSFSPNFLVNPQICRNLRFLSIGFGCYMDRNPKFIEFLTSLQSFPHLLGLDFGFPNDVKHYWSYFKPQSSLRFLKLRHINLNLVKAGDLGHWDEIEELDELEIVISRVYINHMIFVREFITSVLKKIKKLCSLKCSINSFGNALNSSLRGNPLEVEEIPHLYESLQRFEYTFSSSGCGEHLEFDMKPMRVFRSLKEFKLHANGLSSDNIEEIVDLLQINQKEGDFPTLTFKSQSVDSIYWFRDKLEKISQVKKRDKNLQVFMDLHFRIQPHQGRELKTLEGLLNIIKSFGEIKGLFVSITLLQGCWSVPGENFQDVMRKYGELRNLVAKVGHWVYKKIDGEKPQFISMSA